MKLRDLAEIAESRQIDYWNHTALLCVLLANPNRDTNRFPKPFDLYDFHPHLKRPKPTPQSAADFLDRLSQVTGRAPQKTTAETSWVKKSKQGKQ